MRRRGARVDSESEQDELDRPRQLQGQADSDSGLDGDLGVPSSGDEDSDDADDDDDDGAAEPKTPATASVEQLPSIAAAAASTSRHSLKSQKAVLAGQVDHPSWSDLPAPGEDGDTSLPTLDFSNLSIDVAGGLPSPGPVLRTSTLSSMPARSPAAETSAPLNKKQLKEQRRQAKLAALREQNPVEAEQLEKAREEREAAKRLAKKERLKDKRRDRKALERAAREGGLPEATTAPTTVESSLAQGGVLKPTVPKAPKQAKPARPVVPSRPSRTALALGLVNSNTAQPSNSPSPAPPAAAPSSAPAVSLPSMQPAFLPRDAEGRPIPPAANPPVRPPAQRPAEGVADEASDHWERNRGDVPRGFDSYRGRGTGRPAYRDREEVAAPSAREEIDAPGFTGLFIRGRGRARGRGRGLVTRGGLAPRGRTVNGPPGSINPRFAHLPFHPLHRFPSPSASPKPASPAPSNRSSEAVVAAPPEVTSACPDEQLFEAAADESDGPTGVVKLPDGGVSQVTIAVKGAAAAQAARKAALTAGQPVEPSSESVPRAVHTPFDDPGVLYASAPRPAVTDGAPLPASPPARAISAMEEVPPHLQEYAGGQDGAMYYQQQQYSAPYWTPDATESYSIGGPSPAPPSPLPFAVTAAHPPPSSAYFVPPRASRRVEIKPPSSRDGQSPAPSSTSKVTSQPPVDALAAAREIRDAQMRQQQEQQAQAESAYMRAAAAGYGFAPPPPPSFSPAPGLPPSPTATRAPHPTSPSLGPDAFLSPANAPLPAASPAQHAHGPVHALPPHLPMYSPYSHAPPTTYELVAPYPSYYPSAAAYYAPQPVYHQHHFPPPPPPAGPPPAVAYGALPGPPLPHGAYPIGDDEKRYWSGY